VLILDLCGGTGAWSQPYRAAGYRVVVVDPNCELPDAVREDVRLYVPPSAVHGILAAPPCTMFARVGARWKRTPEEMREALSIVDACLRIVVATKPLWWALENPIGKLQTYLGKPVFACDPCDFGDPWTKRIWLWGDFRRPSYRYVRPAYPEHRPKRSRDRTSMLSGSQRRQRAQTSAAFARAFFEANP
jgi:site-specific DNA-cytosine methylase